jgi:hypothetical protein
MHPLHLTKVAYGCTDVDTMRARIEGRAIDGESWVDTRYRPTRFAEVTGGSLFWIIKHQLVARATILGFVEDGDRWRIRLDANVVAVRPRPLRAHQGWRYLKGENAPADLDGEGSDLATMPLPLASELASLGLI